MRQRKTSSCGTQARPVAVRGDDRPGMKKALLPRAALASPATGKPPPGRDAGRPDARGPVTMHLAVDVLAIALPTDRGPRLGDAAFRAQREAMEHAQQALKKLAAEAHGEALAIAHCLGKARCRPAAASAQELGGRVTPAVRTAWTQALGKAPSGDIAQALLRLETC